MEIHYSSSKDEKIFTNQRLIVKQYGRIAKSLMNRLSELRVANSLDEVPEVPPPRRHKLTGNYAGCWGICLSKNERMIIEPFGIFDIEDLKTIKEVKIIGIEDYH